MERIADPDQQRVIEALHLDEVMHVLHVQEQLPTLLVLVRLASGRSQKGRRGWHGRQLVEVPGQDLARHAAPCLARTHVKRRVETVAQTATVRLAQGIGVKENAGYAAELVDDIDAQVPDETVHLLLRRRVQSQPGRLHRVGEEQAVGRVQSPAPGAQVLSSMVWFDCAVAE